jgi:hypothetical protein
MAILYGAGASMGAFPKGNSNDRCLPLMKDFAEIVPVTPVLQKSGVNWRRDRFQRIVFVDFRELRRRPFAEEDGEGGFLTTFLSFGCQ